MSGKAIIGIIVGFILVICSLIGYNMVPENVRPGYVGYVYDRNLSPNSDDAIPGTAVHKTPQYGLVWINPFTQEIYKYPTTIISRSWTKLPTEGSPKDDSFPVGTLEGKNVITDTYLSVQPANVGQIIKSYGGRDFEDIVDRELFGLMKGVVQQVTQDYSIYDFQAKKSEITDKVTTKLKDMLLTSYGITLIRFQFGAVELPGEILTQIEAKTTAINAVELAKLDRQKQDELNKRVVDEQKANSEKDVLKRESEADATSYETQKAADAAAYKLQKDADARKLAATANLDSARLEKSAELEKQQAYTTQYLDNKKLDVLQSAVEKLNPELKIVVTDSSGSGLNAIPGMQMILDEFRNTATAK